MGKYAIKRILQAVLYLFVIITILFLLLERAPHPVHIDGNPRGHPGAAPARL